MCSQRPLHKLHLASARLEAFRTTLFMFFSRGKYCLYVVIHGTVLTIYHTFIAAMWSSWAITWRSGRFPCGTSKASSRRSHDRSCRHFLWNPTSPHGQRFLTFSHWVLTGVLNLRQHSLLSDSVFLWDRRRSDKSGPWQLALRIWGHWPWLRTCSGLVCPPLAAPGLNLLITHCPYFLGFIAATCHIVRKQAGVSDKSKSSQKKKKERSK